MLKRWISIKITWLLFIALALLLLITFTACSDDLIGPRVQDEDDPDDEGSHDEGGQTISNRILQSPGVDRRFALVISLSSLC